MKPLLSLVTHVVTLLPAMTRAANETCPVDYSTSCSGDSDCGSACTCILSGWSGMNNFCAPKGSFWCRLSHPQYYCPFGYLCSDVTQSPCAPPGSEWCYGVTPDGFCRAGSRCVQEHYCVPNEQQRCDGASPPYCEAGWSCVQNRTCAPPGATGCPLHDPPFCVYGAKCGGDHATCLF